MHLVIYQSLSEVRVSNAINSASAVARSWGDKVIAYIRTWEDEAGDNSVFYRSLIFLLDPGFGINNVHLLYLLFPYCSFLRA